ncbi:hypothetical protein [Psychroflexus torquis]|uniref:pirin family protein n=1 Tax=Psychroflexus torquis TaxID=57029 RepID=UPI00145E9A85
MLSPNKKYTKVLIYQKAWFHIHRFNKVLEEVYNLKQAEKRVYIFVLEGKIRIYNYLLSKRGTIGFTETSAIDFDIMENSKA